MALQKITSNEIASGTINATQIDVASANGTGAMIVPTGTTAQRPVVPVVGYQRFNTTTGSMETYNGSSWSGLGGLTLQSVQSSSFTASAGFIYPINTTSGAVTVTLPASPTSGQQVGVIDYAGTASANNITINPNGGKINGGTTSYTINANKVSVTLSYVDSVRGWVELSSAFGDMNPPNYTVSYLVVAGGGGAVGGWSGGGGAGGLLSGSTTFMGGAVYSVVVGAGGANSPTSTQGSTSSLIGAGSGSGLSVSTVGGGAGLGGATGGGPGGSGGGGGGWNAGVTWPGGSGTNGQGYAGGPGQASGPDYAGGGGGGAGGVGSGGGIYAGGPGGPGASSSITGSSVYYAGGGGGNDVARANAGGAGGSGGGGTGGGSNGGSTNGTTNTGGGGGAPGSGGSGVVIISLPTNNYSGTITGFPTVTTSGSNTILTFTSSGSYTA